MFADAPEQADYWKEKIRNNSIASFSSISREDWKPEELIQNMWTGPQLDYFEYYVTQGHIHLGHRTLGMKHQLRKRCLAAIENQREFYERQDNTNKQAS
jgi:hypothetical protein